MKGSEVLKQISGKQPELCFIKWWRKEDDFVDFDLVEQFANRVGADEIVDGYELLDLEGMWQLFIQLNPDNLARVRKGDSEYIHWMWLDKEGSEKCSVYPFSPQGVKTLMDADLFD